MNKSEMDKLNIGDFIINKYNKDIFRIQTLRSSSVVAYSILQDNHRNQTIDNSRILDVYDLYTSVAILYHDSCTDGLGAKYAAWKKYGDDATYLAVQYNRPVPDLLKFTEVYIVDFCYPKAVLEEIKNKVSKLLVIDHHKTAEEDLAGVDYAIFDMNKSGAVLAWEYFHPRTPVPGLLEYIQDRDIWTWKLKDTKSALNVLKLHGNDVTTWDELDKTLLSRLGQGIAVSLYQDVEIKSAIREDKIKFGFYKGFKVAITNVTHLTSEVLSQLCESWGIDFSIGYFIDPNGVVCLSFRSIGDFDVSALAKELGGGGHKNASGARANLDWLKKLYDGTL
jgi:hypothetical protein